MTKDEYGDFALRYKGCGACFPMYHTLSRFEKMWFSAIQKDVVELEKENVELKKNCEDLKEFYEKEYFEIADRTADEKIKELEEYQEEVTVDDYSPYDENTWGMMHEEMYVPKELVRDLLKESYALSEHRKDQLIKSKELLKRWVELSKPKLEGYPIPPIQEQTEQFLNSEVEK